MANKVQVTFDFKANLGNIKSQMSQLQQMVNQVNKSSHLNFGMSTETFATFKTNLNELSMHMKKAFDPNTGSMNFAALNRSIAQSGKTLGQYGRELIQTGRMGEQAFTQMASAIMSSNAPMMKTSATLTKLWGTFKNTLRWQISSSVLMGFTSTIQQGVQYAKDLNKSLNDIQVVTGKTNEQMKKVEQTASRMAKELKSSTLEIAKAQLIYYQQGDAAALASKKAEITTKAAAVAFNSSAQQMSEYLTAIWNSYQVGESQLESFVDKLAAIGATTATSMEEIATAMQKVAATANSVGVTFDQLNATIATISSATRVGAEQVGTALKTIYARIGDLKIGADEDGMGLGQVSSQLKAMGINILDAQNNLRDMGTIVEEIGNKWQTWTDAQQAAVAQAVAGKRQYTQLFALFDNWEDYQMSLVTSQTATGTLETQFETWGTSWEAASNRVKQSAETIYSSLFEDEAFIDMTNILADFLNGIGNVVKGLGGMGGTLSVLGAVFMTVFQGQIYGALTNFFTNVSLAKQSLVDLAIVGARRAANGLKESQSAVDSTNTKVSIFTKTVNALSNALSRLGNKKTSLETTLGGISDALQGQNLRTEEGKSLARNVAIQRAKTKAESSGPMSPMRQEMLEQQIAEAQEKSNALYDARVRYKEASDLHFSEGSFAGDAARKSFEALKKNPLDLEAQKQYRDDRTRELRASMGFGEDAADQKNFRETLKTRSDELQQKIIKETQKSNPNVKNLQKLKKEFESVQGTLNQYDEANRQANNEVNKLAKGYEEVSKASKDYSSALGKIGKFDKNSMKDIASGLASITQGFGSAAMGASMLINGVKGLFQTINDESMSVTDKLGAILSSLASIGMALPMLSSGWKVMGQGMKTLNSVKIGGGAAKVATQVADKAADAKENATKAKEIATQEKNTAMLAANNQALDRNTVAESTDGNTPNLNNSGKKKLNLSKNNPKKGKSFVQTGGKPLSGTGGTGGGAASGASAGTSVGSILGVAAITIAAAIAAWKIVDYTQKESERSAQKAAEALKMQQEAYNQTKSEYEEFTASADKLNDINIKMSSMTKGTTEFTDALLQANDEVVNLISKYPELAKYTEILDDGRMSISQEGLDFAREQQQTALRKQQAVTMNSTIISQNATSDARAEKLAKDSSKRDETAIGTAMGMAAAGAIAGSIIPGLGNIVGALVGGAAGLISGVVTAATINPSDDFEKLVEEIQKNGLDVMDDNVRLSELTGRTVDEIAKLKPDLMKLANEVNANSIATKQLTKEMIGANNEDKLKDRSVNEQNAIKNFFVDQASSPEVDKLVKEKYTNHGLAALFSGGNNDKAINEDWVKMMIAQSEGTGITDYKVTEGVGDTVKIKYFKDGQWIEEEGTRSQKQMAEEVARYNLTTLSDENLKDFEKERDKIANVLQKDGSLDSGIIDIANQLLSGEQVDMSSLSEEQLHIIEDNIANSTLFSKEQKMNLAKAIGNYTADVEEANNSAIVSFNRSSAKLADIITSFRAVIEDINELDRIDTDSISKIKDAALKAGMDETTWASYEDRLWLHSGNKQEISNIMGDIIRSQFSSTLSNVNLIGNKDQGINSETIEERMTILTNQLKSAGVQNASAVAKATITNKILQEMLEKGYDDTQIANFLKNNGYDYSEAELFDKKLGAFAKGLATGTVKSETLTQEIKDMTSGLEDATDALKIFSAKLLATDMANKYFSFDENGNVRTRLKSTANADIYTDAEGNVLNIADWDTKAETVKNAFGEEEYKQIVADGEITQKYEELLGLNASGVSKTWTNNMDYLEAQSEIFMKQQLLNNTAEDYQIGPTPEETEEYNKDRLDKIEDIVEKEKEFIEDLADAWETEYSESVKETLEKTFDELSKYEKKLDTLDFGIDLLNGIDAMPQAQLLQNKYTTMLQYGEEMRAEFNELANTIPQTAEAAQEVASRIEELGGNMRSNITNIRETQVEMQKLKITAISDWASNKSEALNRELDSLTRRIDLLQKDSHSNNFKYTNQMLHFDLMFADVDGDKYQKQIKDKATADKEIIKKEQETQDTINKIISNALEMQQQENRKKRAEERDELVADFKNSMEDIKEELADLEKEFNNKFSAMTDSVSSLTAEINQLKETANDIPINLRYNVTNKEVGQAISDYSKNPTPENFEKVVDKSFANEDGAKGYTASTILSTLEGASKRQGGGVVGNTQHASTSVSSNTIGELTALGFSAETGLSSEISVINFSTLEEVLKGLLFVIDEMELDNIKNANSEDMLQFKRTTDHILSDDMMTNAFKIPKDQVERKRKLINTGLRNLITAKAGGDEEFYNNVVDAFKKAHGLAYSEGTKYHPGGLAVLGDEFIGAYELAITPDGKATLYGKDGPEIIDLPAGTAVYTHDETKKMLEKSGGIENITYPAYQNGVGNNSNVSYSITDLFKFENVQDEYKKQNQEIVKNYKDTNKAIIEKNKETKDNIVSEQKNLTEDINVENENQVSNFQIRGENMVSDNKLAMEQSYTDTKKYIDDSVKYAEENPIKIILEEVYIPSEDKPGSFKDNYNIDTEKQAAINDLANATKGKTNDFGIDRYKTNNSMNFSSDYGYAEWCADYVSYFITSLANSFDKNAQFVNANGQKSNFSWQRGVAGLRDKTGVSSDTNDLKALSILYKDSAHTGIVTSIGYLPDGTLSYITVAEGNTTTASSNTGNSNTNNHLTDVEVTTYYSLNDFKKKWNGWSVNPIQFYATGTKGHPGGAAVVGDQFKGAYEAVISPDGKMSILGEENAMMMDLPKGTQVIPHDETKKILDSGVSLYADGTGMSLKDLVKSALGDDENKIETVLNNASTSAAYSLFNSGIITKDDLNNIIVELGKGTMSGSEIAEKLLESNTSLDRITIHQLFGKVGNTGKQKDDPYAYKRANRQILSTEGFSLNKNNIDATKTDVNLLLEALKSVPNPMGYEEWKKWIETTYPDQQASMLSTLNNLVSVNEQSDVKGALEEVLGIITDIENNTYSTSTAMQTFNSEQAEAASYHIKNLQGFSGMSDLNNLNAEDAYFKLNDIAYYGSELLKTDKSDTGRQNYLENTIASIVGSLNLDYYTIFGETQESFKAGLENVINATLQTKSAVLGTYDKDFSKEYNSYKSYVKNWDEEIVNIVSGAEQIKISKTAEEKALEKKATNLSNMQEENVIYYQEYIDTMIGRKMDEEFLIQKNIETAYEEYLENVENGTAVFDMEIIEEFNKAASDSTQRMQEYNDKLAEAIKSVDDYYNGLIEHNSKITSLNDAMISQYTSSAEGRSGVSAAQIGQLVYENMQLEQKNLENAHKLAEWYRSQNYSEDSSEIIAAKQSYVEAENKIIAYRQQLADIVKEALEREKEEQINLLNYEKQAYTIAFDFESNILDLRKNINDKLTESQTLYAYLDKTTRKLLFNEEDYLALNKELTQLQIKQNALATKYEKDIIGKTAAEIQYITEEYERQTNLLMKQYEIKEAELEVVKKRTELENTLNERNVQMFINGRWQWVADMAKVADAQKALNDAEYTVEQKKREKTKATEETKIETQINKIEQSWARSMELMEGELISSEEALSAFGNILSWTTKGPLLDFFNTLNGTSHTQEEMFTGKQEDNTLYGQTKQIGTDVVGAAKDLYHYLNSALYGTDEKEVMIAKQQVKEYASKLSSKGYSELANTILQYMTDSSITTDVNTLLNSLPYATSDTYYNEEGKLVNWFESFDGKSLSWDSVIKDKANEPTDKFQSIVGAVTTNKIYNELSYLTGLIERGESVGWATLEREKYLKTLPSIEREAILNMSSKEMATLANEAFSEKNMGWYAKTNTSLKTNALNGFEVLDVDQIENVINTIKTLSTATEISQEEANNFIEFLKSIGQNDLVSELGLFGNDPQIISKASKQLSNILTGDLKKTFVEDILDLKKSYVSAETDQEKNKIAGEASKVYSKMEAYGFSEEVTALKGIGADHIALKNGDFASIMGSINTVDFAQFLQNPAEYLLNKIVSNKMAYESEKEAGDMSDAEQIAEETKGFYYVLESLGYNDLAKELSEADLETAKALAEKGVEAANINSATEIADADINTQKIIDNANENKNQLVDAIKNTNDNNKNNSSAVGSTALFNPNIDYQALINQAKDNGADQSYIDALNASRNAKIAAGYASGTISALEGLHRINELGEETFVTPDGHFRNFAGGEVVFTHEQSQRLFSLLNADLFDTGKGIGKVGNFEQLNSNDTYINIGGISVDTTSQDGKDLVEILQRITNI